MTDTPAEPDWNLLPHDPVRFFRLSAGFDRRELKRSYNELLRRFKPERFPVEFQRIRAAYEQLENALRYGQSTEPVVSPVNPAEPVEWKQETPAAAPLGAKRFDELQPTARAPLHERIKSGNVSEIYRELKDKPGKSPYEFYALAVISDAVDRQGGKQFIRWILEGLTAHPNEVGLSRLLHAYCNGPVETEHCPELLLACSRVVREELFFPLTEPLWRQLLRSQKFSEFRTTLEQCEANLKGIHIDNRLAFYLQILKPAIWVADLEWIRASYQFVEQNFDRIPKFLDYDLEILSRLRAYSEIREQFVQGNEMRQALDRAMRDYFSEDQLTGDQSVLACQVQMAQDSSQLAGAFADFGNPMYSAFFAVWIWVSYDVGERHVEPPKETTNQTIWHDRTRMLLNQLEQQTKKSRLGFKWAMRRLFYGGMQVVGFFACIFVVCVFVAGVSTTYLFNSHKYDAVAVLALFAGIGLSFFILWRVNKWWTKRHWRPFQLEIAGDCYRQIWQREIINFLARSHLPHQTLRAYIHSFPNYANSTAWVKHYFDLDFSLPMFAIAHHFVV